MPDYPPHPCNNTPNPNRRRLLYAASAAAVAAGAVVALPFVANLAPFKRNRASGTPVEIDISKLLPGELKTVEWGGNPVWIVGRSPEMLATLSKVEPKLADPQSRSSQQPDYARNAHRSIKPEVFVVIGICTHQGCTPAEKFRTGSAQGMAADWDGGFLCPCHGSLFDLAGRVLKNMPAPTNLEIPPYQFLADTRLLIGDDHQPT
jgi:ubiquinol-cytochrome c reductase iron-sulfur subunit